MLEPRDLCELNKNINNLFYAEFYHARKYSTSTPVTAVSYILVWLAAVTMVYTMMCVQPSAVLGSEFSGFSGFVCERVAKLHMTMWQSPIKSIGLCVYHGGGYVRLYTT
jgi:hypothetical protein